MPPDRLRARTALGPQHRSSGVVSVGRHARIHRGYAVIASTSGTFSIQGHWWYRGEWTFDASAGQVRLVNRVFNIAVSHRWAVPLANKLFIGYRDGLQQGIDEFVRTGGAEFPPDVHR